MKDTLPRCPFKKGTHERKGWVEGWLMTFGDLPDGAFEGVMRESGLDWSDFPAPPAPEARK